MILESQAFTQNQLIPREHTADGVDVSPALVWSGIPPTTSELALIVDDPDAPTAEPWVHWILYKIPPSTTELIEHIPSVLRVAALGGALQGKNSWPDRIGYSGPEPPRGHGLHHYHFQLYALNAPLDLEPGVDKASLLAAMQGHILATGELVGTYER